MSALATAPMRSLLDTRHKAKQPDTDDEVWCLNLDQIESHSGKVLSKFKVKASDVGPSTYAFEKGTVLYCKLRPYLNKVVVADADGMATTEPLRCDASKVLPDYLAHFLRSPTFLAFATNVVAGAKMPRMVMGEFWAYPVPLLSPKEQRHIAAILDQAETLRTQRRAALAHLDSLTQSIFLDMFGEQTSFPLVPLDQVCELITDGTHYTPTYADEGVIFLSAKNVTSGRVDWDQIKHIPESLHQELHKRVAPKLGDVLMAKNGTTGVAAIVDRDCTFDIYVSLALLRPSRKVGSVFLHAALNSPLSKKQFNAALKGIGVPNLHLKDIRGAKIPLPPLALQQTFATRIQAIEALKTTHRAALAELDALFASLQQRAFSGELTRPASAVVSTCTKRDLSAMCLLDAKKMLEALIYVAKRMPEHDFYKSLKALYSGDRQHLENHGSLIYGETYEALDHGPVPKAAYALTKGLEEAASGNLFADDPMSIPLQRTGNQLIPARDADFGVLSAAERKSLDWAIKYYGPMNFGETKTASHDAAYRATASNAPIAIEDIIRTLPEAAQRRFFG